MLQYRAGGSSENMEGQVLIKRYLDDFFLFPFLPKYQGNYYSNGPAIPFLHLRRHISKVKHVLHMKMK